MTFRRKRLFTFDTPKLKTMKHIFTLLLFCVAVQFSMAQYCGGSGPGVCTPSGSLTTVGFGPSSENLPPLVNGNVSVTVLQFKNYNSIFYAPMGINLTVQSLRFDTINNLPQGLCWATNKANNTYANQEDGCIQISGVTCADPGVYMLEIWATMNVGITTLSVNLSTLGLKYFLRVKNTSDLDIALDTLQAIPFTKPGGYSASADCNLMYGVDLGADQSVCNGSVVTLNPIVSAGVSPYTFLWSSSGSSLSCTTCKNPVTTVSQTSTYSVTVIDANNQQVSDATTYTASGGSNNMQLNVSNTGIDCTHPQDTTVVTVTNGASPYTFNWGDGFSNTGTSPNQHNYTQGGSFVISVSDNNGCATSVLDTIAFNGISVTASQMINPTCVNQNTGKIKVSASGGTAPYTFHWNNGATADSIVNVSAGNYWVTVTDAALCSTVSLFNLSPLNGWGYYTYLSSTPSNCGISGTITNSVHGGAPPYTYNWTGGITTPTLSYLNSGTYAVTVTDSLGCAVMASAYVTSGCHSIISGIVYNDTSGNCIYNAGENLMGGLYVSATSNGQTIYGTTNSNGQYSISVTSSGTYVLQAYNYSSYGSCGNLALCGNPNQTITIGTLGDTVADNNFAFQSSSGFDLNLFIRWSSSNPGFLKDYRIYPSNASSNPFTGQATVTFAYDSNLIYQGSNQTVIHDFANHTLTWTVDSLNIYWWLWGGNNEILASFLVPVNMSLNYMLQSDFYISPTVGDCDSSNNHIHTTGLVTGSYDPNEKTVEPAGKILEEDSVLTYTIGFQNTGTDSTHFIIVKDTLSSNLNAATVRNIASSHPYSEFTISGNGILTWVFNPLRLVDSFTNEPGSHGFVMFTVKKKSNMPIGSIISNTAHIYFDYNVPVVTNTVADTVSEPNYISALRSEDGISVKAFPNPFSNATNILVEGLKGSFNFELYDVTGRLRNKISSTETNQFQLQSDELSSGVYFYRITSVNKKQSGYGKLVVE